MYKQEIVLLVNELDSFTPCLLPTDQQKQLILVDRIITESKKWSKAQQVKTVLALRYSAMKHKSIYRDNRLTPYFIHALEVACKAFDSGVFDFKLTVAAILHDTIEDTKGKNKKEMLAKKKEARAFIQKNFGAGVYVIVDAVTKHEEPALRAEFWHFLVSVKYLPYLWRAIFLKFCDRIVNSETFHDLEDKARIEKKVSETIREFPHLKIVLQGALNELYRKKVIRKKSYLQLPDKLMKLLGYNLVPYLPKT